MCGIGYQHLEPSDTEAQGMVEERTKLYGRTASGVPQTITPRLSVSTGGVASFARQQASAVVVLEADVFVGYIILF